MNVLGVLLCFFWLIVVVLIVDVGSEEGFVFFRLRNLFLGMKIFVLGYLLLFWVGEGISVLFKFIGFGFLEFL